MVSGCQMLAVSGLSQAMGVESFSGWILDTTMFNLIFAVSRRATGHFNQNFTV